MKNNIALQILYLILLLCPWGCRTTVNQSTASWTVSKSDGAEITLDESGDILRLGTLYAGSYQWQVKLQYNRTFLLQAGYKYKLSFSARTYDDKIMDVGLTGNADDNIPDNAIEYLDPEFTGFLVTGKLQTFEFEFINRQAEAGYAVLGFHITGDISDVVFIGDISLEVTAQEIPDKPAVVGVMDLFNLQNDNYLNTACRSIADTIFFTLNNIGKYEAERITGAGASNNAQDLKRLAGVNAYFIEKAFIGNHNICIVQ